jgi:aminoglycoside phosphotransferase (APT) family kinase protein
LGGTSAKDLREHPDRFKAPLATLLGRTIASIHGIRRSGAPNGFRANGTSPWVFTLASEHPRYSGKPGESIFRVLRKYPEYRVFLEELDRDWRATSLIHADMKFDNCVSNEDGTRLSIIDWELANWGDPCWDVAGIVQCYWADWIRERAPFETIRATIAQFFTSWRESYSEHPGAGNSAIPARDLLTRTMRLAAARLVQRSWEEGHLSDPLPNSIVQMLQLSLNVFADPDRAGRELVGVEG